MKRLISLGLVTLLIGITTTTISGGQDRGGNEAIQARFVGAWRLVSLEAPGPDGKIHKADSTGLFVFTRDGHASVQVMYRTPPAGAAAAPVQYAQGGYEATFGRYRVDPSARTFTYHVEGARVRSLIGKDLVRSYEFSGNELIVKSSDTKERWRVAWEHY